jgi:hypothetical protein
MITDDLFRRLSNMTARERTLFMLKDTSTWSNIVLPVKKEFHNFKDDEFGLVGIWEDEYFLIIGTLGLPDLWKPAVKMTPEEIVDAGWIVD